MFLQCLACTCKVAVSVGVRQVLWRLWSAFSTLSWLSQLEPGYHKPTQKICVVCIESIIQTCSLPRQYLGVSMSPIAMATCKNNSIKCHANPLPTMWLQVMPGVNVRLHPYIHWTLCKGPCMSWTMLFWWCETTAFPASQSTHICVWLVASQGQRHDDAKVAKSQCDDAQQICAMCSQIGCQWKPILAECQTSLGCQECMCPKCGFLV